jgi:phage-related protein
MAEKSRTLKLSILGDVDQLKKSLSSGSNEVQSFGSKVGDFGKKAAAAFAVAAVAAAAFALKFAKDAIVAGEAAATANARIEQINKSMGLFGDSVAVVSDRLIDYAEKTARATGIDTNSIKATQAKLLTFKELALTAGEVGGEFDRATKAAIDLASAGFGTAETNAVQLGKALNDPIKGLTSLAKSGVTFTTQEKERIKVLVESNKIGEAQALILAAIETQVGGTAEATANATDKMKIGFQQVSEKVGIALLPILEKLTNFLLDKLFPAFETYILPIVEKITAAFSSQNGGLGKTVSNLASTLKSTFLPIWEGVKSAFDKVKATVIENKDEFQAFFDVVKAAAPIIGKVIGAAFNVAGTVASTVLNLISNVLGALKTIINTAIDGINLVIRGLNLIKPGPDIASIGKIGSSTGSSSTGGISVPLASLPTGFKPAGTISTIPTPTPTPTPTPVASVAASAATAAAAAKKSNDAFKFGTSGVNTNTLAGIMAASGQPSVVINVNSPSIIDEEGFTRALNNAQNNSFFRGTGGATNLVGI